MEPSLHHLSVMGNLEHLDENSYVRLTKTGEGRYKISAETGLLAWARSKIVCPDEYDTETIKNFFKKHNKEVKELIKNTFGPNLLANAFTHLIEKETRERNINGAKALEKVANEILSSEPRTAVKKKVPSQKTRTATLKPNAKKEKGVATASLSRNPTSNRSKNLKGK